jgi:predicted Fe-Mo cluster-binding NifX family protein
MFSTNVHKTACERSFFVESKINWSPMTAEQLCTMMRAIRVLAHVTREQEERLQEKEMIRVAVPADEDKGLDSVVSPDSGSCPYLVLVDFEERKVKTVRTVPSSHDGQHQPGQIPGIIHGQWVDVMLTGGAEGRAIALFQQYRVRSMTGALDTVRHMLEQYVGYRLEEAKPYSELPNLSGIEQRISSAQV